VGVKQVAAARFIALPKKWLPQPQKLWLATMCSLGLRRRH